MNTVISLAPALKFNGGGHINHTIFWQNLSPDGGEPEGKNFLCSAVSVILTMYTKFAMFTISKNSSARRIRHKKTSMKIDFWIWLPEVQREGEFMAIMSVMRTKSLIMKTYDDNVGKDNDNIDI